MLLYLAVSGSSRQDAGALADLISGSQRMPAQLLLGEKEGRGGRWQNLIHTHI